jgi:hypothetical protein
MLSILLCNENTSALTAKDLFSGVAVVISIVSIIISSKSSNTGTKSAIAMQCLNKYLEIVKDDIQKHLILIDKEKVDDFWRELFDLQFTQYHLWLNKHVENSMMQAWCESRRNDFELKKDKYIETWNTLKAAKYFPDINFVNFMDDVHNKNISMKKVLKKHSKDKKRKIFGIEI